MSLFICQIKLVLATVAFSSTKYRLEGNDEGFQSKETWKIIHIWPHLATFKEDYAPCYAT